MFSLLNRPIVSSCRVCYMFQSGSQYMEYKNRGSALLWAARASAPSTPTVCFKSFCLCAKSLPIFVWNVYLFAQRVLERQIGLQTYWKSWLQLQKVVHFSHVWNKKIKHAKPHKTRTPVKTPWNNRENSWIFTFRKFANFCLDSHRFFAFLGAVITKAQNCS